MLKTTRSTALFQEALTCFPGGVNSPVRAFRAVGRTPLFIERGAGPYLYDVDGNRFIDYVMSYGPLILGHADPGVVAALAEAAAGGTSYGAPCPAELALARLIRAAIPDVEMMRFVNSGTEATMSALRLARAVTGRSRIIKFAGCYHGHADLLLVQAGSGVATLGLPDSPGVPPATVADTLVASYNDLESVAQLFDVYPGEIAAVIVEAVAGNMGVVPPEAGFLEGLRAITEQNGTLLIFDEVMTGFRVHPGGAQALYGIRPDLTTLGKVIGGGLPVGAYGGRRDVMEQVAPAGPVYQAGTLSGNPLAMAAGRYTLERLTAADVWEALEAAGAYLEEGLDEAARAAGVHITQHRVGTMSCVFFHEGPVRDWASAKQSDTAAYAVFFGAMLEQGVYLAPSQFEAAFLAATHTREVLDATVTAAAQAFRRVKQSKKFA